MRHSCLILAALIIVSSATIGSAQPGDVPLSPREIAAACSPPPSMDDAPPHALRIIGSQDTTPRSLFGDRDLLVINGGTAAGVQLGQQFFIRRTMTFGGNRISRGAKTLGWTRVVAVNESTSIVLVDHVCGGIISNDYLAPFAVPEVSASLEATETTTGRPDFQALGHIVIGNEDRVSAGAGDFVLIDWGQAQGPAAGTRFAIYRDVGIGGLPLASVGEGVVVSVGTSLALTRLTRARDAVISGDLVAFRR
jgi:hypothetical protein